MRFKTTLFLLLIVIALGGAILGVERFLPSTRELMEMKRGPVKFDPKQVTQIEIDSSGGDGVTLAWDGTQWWVRRPFNDLADPEKVAQVLNLLGNIGWIERVHRNEFDDSGWSKTMLDQPRQKLRLLAGNQPLFECWLGAPSAVEGSLYLSLISEKTGREPAHYVARTALFDVVKTSPKAWRDAKLVRLPANTVTGLKISQAGGVIEVVRGADNHSWSLVKPLSTRASKERILELLSTLLNLEITDAAEAPNGGAAASPVAALTEGVSDELKVTLVAGEASAPHPEITLKKPAANETTTTATASHRKPVFTVTSKSIADLWAPPNELRDRKLARIDEDAVTAVEITSAAFPPVLLSKQEESWFLQRHGRLEPANGERVARLFHALNSHVVQAFAADSAANLGPYGLDHPIQTVSWTRGTEKATLLFGKNAENAEFFAKYEGEPSVFRIDASLLPALSPEGIKWKGLGALRFSQFALRKISLALGTAPAIELTYDPTTAQWTAERAGRDITPMIDRVKADRMAGMLAKLNVHDWVADRTDAVQALKNPELRVQIVLGEPGTNEGPVREINLNFAPTQPGAVTAFYYGQIDAGPEVFYITRPALVDLIANPFKTE